MGPVTFTCELCNRTFEQAWSDEEARNELVQVFGPDALRQPLAVVCGVCYDAMANFYGWEIPE